MSEEAKTKKELVEEIKTLQKKINRLEKANGKSNKNKTKKIRVRAEKLIGQSEARLKRAELASKSGNWELHLDSKIMYSSEGAEKIYGVDKSPIDYKIIRNNPLPEYRSLLDTALKNLIKKNLPYDLEFKIKTTDTGEIKDIHSIAEYDKERRILFGVIQDITSRKRTEDILRESENRYHSIFENNISAVLLSAPDGKILAANPEACRIFGRTEDELCLLGRESVVDITDPRLNSAIEERTRNGKFKGELTLIRKDGTKFPALIAGNTFLDKEGNEQITIAVNDITDQKRADQELRQLNRELRAVSSCNQTLLHAVDEQSLLNQICSIICDEAGYSLALVAYVEQDEAKTVRPVAWAGIHYDDIINAKLSWSDKSEFGQGPVGRTVRSGVKIYVQDFQTDPMVAYWRESLLQHGYRSGITLPLKDENSMVFGVLIIYASIPDAVTPAEIRLIEELTSDLEFGIITLRNRREGKRAENIIIESERRFKELANLLPQSIYEADLNGFITFTNETGLTTFGYTPGDMANGIHILDSISEEDKLEAFESLHRVLKGLPAGKNEFEMRRKDGTTFPALTFTSPVIRDGKITGLRGTIVDISRQKQTEIELRRLSEAVAQSPALVFITNVDGSINYVNKTFEETTGYSFNEVINRNPRILKSGYTKLEEYKVLWDTISSGKTWRGELKNKKKNGDFYWEDALISPIKDKNGSIINYLAVKQDITGKKKMTEELIAAKNQAERSDNLKSEFLAQMSHEVRTPMNVTINCANIIKEILYDNINEETLKYFESIELAGKRLIRTVDLILNVSEMQLGTYSPTFENVELMKDILDNLRTEFSGYASHKELDFTVISTVPKPSICCDIYSVNQIFVNLIDNAVKYTHKGSVAITVDRDPGGKIRTVVSDTGIGMSEEFLGRMFEPFTQEQRGYSRRYEGNGLGLALVKKYCDLNEVKIEVESEKNKGSKFILTFLKK
jgi:PAS domain S-box-containing protein